MILDFVDLSSDDDDDDEVLAREHYVHGKGNSVHVKAEIVDLTSDDDIFEGEHLAHGQCDAAQGTALLKQEFFRDDRQAEDPQCTVKLQMQELGADVGQTDGSLCATTLEMQEHEEDDGQGDASQSTATLHMLELRAAHAEGDAVQCITMLQRQELGAKVGQGHAVQCIATLQMQEHKDVGQGDAAQSTITLRMQELRTDHAQGEAVQCIPTLQRQELSAEVGQGDAGQYIATSQMQEHKKDVRQGDATQSTVTLQMQELRADYVQGNSVQCITTLQSKSAEVGHLDAAQCISTLQMQELLADDVQGDAAQSTTTLQMEELTADDGQDTASQFTPTLELTQGDVLCTTALKRQQLNLDDRQDAVALCTTTLPRQKSTSDGAQDDVPRITTALWRQESDTAHGKAGQNRIRIHPKFLHSNATSHKWPFGAIAELLDNAIDEVNNGATFVKIDKMKHSLDGGYALVIEDNGGGMSPESIRHCMSFGFSQKCTTASIGQYGNGFKTSTMRLGADAIVFTCTKDNRRLTRSVGLLSYTFLRRTKCNDIFVPAVDYEFDAPSSTFKRIMNCSEKHFSSNLSTLLRWSPFPTEGELLDQFSNMGCHGTKIIVFNLWFNDALEMELDFDTDKQDIMISGAPEIRAGHNTVERLTQMHVANRFRYSLRVDVITTIGYLSGAPRLDIYGFSVYHKNRLILPYWRAGSCNRQRRGIAGVLEANFIRPTHDKQDFEKTGLFQRLETRLKDMATEYWTSHCHLVGYSQVAKRPPPAHYISTTADHDDHNLVAQATTNPCNYNSIARAPVALHACASGYNMRYPLHVDLDTLPHQMDCDACPSASINVVTTSYTPCNAPQQSETELCRRRKPCSEIFWRAQKRRNTNVYSDEPGSENGTEEAEEGFRVVLDQNTMLKDECSQLEAAGKLLTSKAEEVRKEIGVWRRVHKSLTEELQFYAGLEGLRRVGHLGNPGIGFGFI